MSVERLQAQLEDYASLAAQMADTLRGVHLASGDESYPWSSGALRGQVAHDIADYERLVVNMPVADPLDTTEGPR